MLSLNLATTVIHPDLTREVIQYEHAQDPDLDIFFVHPTVNTSPEPGQDDMSDLTAVKEAVAESAARFSTIGRVISPLYRSATAGCFLTGGEVLDDCLEFAYQDVEASFQYYLANHWDGRKLVMMGWSQGAVMTRMLMERFVANHSDLLSRIVVVMPIGGDLEVDSLGSVPACVNVTDTGCHVAYHTFLEGAEPHPGTVLGDWSDEHAACNDVAGVAGEPGVYTTAFFSLPTVPGVIPTDALSPVPFDIDTAFMAFPAYFQGGCVGDGSGHVAVNQVDLADQRWAPINLAHPFVVADPPFGLGLHLFDFSIAMGDLLELVEIKAEQLEDNDEFCVID